MKAEYVQYLDQIESVHDALGTFPKNCLKQHICTIVHYLEGFVRVKSKTQLSYIIFYFNMNDLSC